MEQVFTTRSPEETERLAEKLGARLRGGEVLAFTGGMGMGKTAFVRGLARGMGISAPVASPTFALLNEYPGHPSLAHFDMYRIESWADLETTGFLEFPDPGWVVAVEWSENIENALPSDAIRIDLRPGAGENERIITLWGFEGGTLC